MPNEWRQLPKRIRSKRSISNEFMNQTAHSTIFDCSPFWRAEKITWTYRNHDPNSVLDRIKSKSARKFLRKFDLVMDEYHFRYEISSCSKQDFTGWLELYHQRSLEKHLDIIATPAWYDQRKSEGKIIEKIFFFQGKSLIGGKIITISKDQVVRSAFKASIPFDFKGRRNASLGILLDYIYLEHYSKRDVRLITGGRSRNLFGITNSIGYLCFKLRVGYMPEVMKADNVIDQSFGVPKNRSFLSFMTSVPDDCRNPDLFLIGSNPGHPSDMQELGSLFKYQSFPSKGA